MAVPSRQIGWSTESNLLWQICNQIDRMTGVIGSTLSTFVPQSRTLTINGVTYDLSADRSWTVAAGVTGSGAAGQVAYWNGTNSQTGSNNLFWDAANSSLGIGSTSLTGYSLRVSKNITGASSSAGIQSDGIIQSDVTGSALIISTNPSTAASTFNLTNLFHYRSSQGTFGIGSTVTNQYGVFIDSTLIGAVNNYGFYGNIASATNRWNIYMAGTANNYLAGKLLIGTTTVSTFALDVNGTARVSGNVQVGGGATYTEITSTGAGTSAINVYRKYISVSNGVDNGIYIDAGDGASAIAKLYITGGSAGQPLCINGGGRETVFGSDTSTSSTTALVRMESTTKGFLPPRMTNAQRAAISSPAVGLIVYCTDANEGLYQYINNAWVNITGVVTNRQTASYTLALGDSNDLVEMNVATANNLTVPLNSSVAFPIGTKIDIAQYGAGQTTVVATSGVTVRSAGGALKLAAQYSGATLVKIGTDEWYLFGDITV